MKDTNTMNTNTNAAADYVPAHVNWNIYTRWPLESGRDEPCYQVVGEWWNGRRMVTDARNVWLAGSRSEANRMLRELRRDCGDTAWVARRTRYEDDWDDADTLAALAM